MNVRYGITDRDLLIILGNVSINYFGDYRDQRSKDTLAMIPATILCIHGNQDRRSSSLSRDIPVIIHHMLWYLFQ